MKRARPMSLAKVDSLLAVWFRRLEYEIGSLVRHPRLRLSTHQQIWTLLECIGDLINASGAKVEHPLMPLVEMRAQTRLSELRELVDIAGGIGAIASFSRLCRSPGCFAYEDHARPGLCWWHDWEGRRHDLAPIARVEPVPPPTTAEAADAE